MRFLRWVPFVALALALVAVACGDGADAPTSTPTATPAAADSADNGPFGRAPQLGENVTDVAPKHASSVRRATLRPTSFDRPGGICFDVNFEGFDSGNLQWFRFALDGVEQTTELTWFPRAENTQATGCYMPTELPAVGVHEAAVSVQNPSNLSEPTRQVVEWAFEVTP
jgi:hypothetical protein